MLNIKLCCQRVIFRGKLHRQEICECDVSHVFWRCVLYCASVKSDADMGRSVCAEEKIEKTVDSFYKEPWTIGLLIGQVTWI